MTMNLAKYRYSYIVHKSVLPFLKTVSILINYITPKRCRHGKEQQRGSSMPTQHQLLFNSADSRRTSQTTATPEHDQTSTTPVAQQAHRAAAQFFYSFFLFCFIFFYLFLSSFFIQFFSFLLFFIFFFIYFLLFIYFYIPCQVDG